MMFAFRLRQRFSLSSSFTVLGLKSTCKMNEVKMKYLELAKKYHPDVNSEDKNAHNKFAQINKAYQHIVDNYDQQSGFYEPKASNYKSSQAYKQKQTETKHKNYKRQKSKGQQEQYEDFYQYDDFFKHSKKFRKPKKGEDIYMNLTINLQESILGTEKSFTYTRYEPCSGCATKDFSACFSCGGKGQIYDRVDRQKVRCEYCSGKGFKNECLDCIGASYVLREVNDKIYIEKGTKDKTILRAERKGHSGYKANNGDLYVTIFIEESNKFRIDGNNVHSQHELDFVTAVCGGKTFIETVYGLKELQIKAGTQSGQQFRLFNNGLKSPYSKRLGDHIVKIKIKIPDILNEKQKRLLRELE